MDKQQPTNIEIETTDIFDALILIPRVIVDNRGFFSKVGMKKPFKKQLV